MDRLTRLSRLAQPKADWAIFAVQLKVGKASLKDMCLRQMYFGNPNHVERHLDFSNNWPQSFVLS